MKMSFQIDVPDKEWNNALRRTLTDTPEELVTDAVEVTKYGLSALFDRADVSITGTTENA